MHDLLPDRPPWYVAGALGTALGIFLGVRIFLRREVVHARQQTGLAPQAP